MAESFQASLFNPGSDSQVDNSRKPLAARMRPRSLDEIIGQRHLLREDALLPKLIQADRFGSLLFWGPPGCGKTTFARVIAAETNSHFIQINAVLSNVAELKQILLSARSNPSARTVLFIDELHRFNKAQQDLLLPDVEEGNIRLIGATTHNPGFYIIPPLVSRSHLFKLEPLSEEQVAEALEMTLVDSERGLGGRVVQADPELILSLAKLCDGDLRRALNALEVLVESASEGHVLSATDLEAFASERQIRYDANEDEHYNTASAFIKSMRGGDPDAALYWMAKMLAGGEDPRFIARRLVILASEDVGLADPMALPLAVAAKEACEFVGQPECELNLAHAVIYLATAPKSNSATAALGKVKQHIRDNSAQAVPKWLQDLHSKVSRSQRQGEGYLYSHNYPEAVSGQEYMLDPKQFYAAGQSGREKYISERLQFWRELKAQIKTQNQ